MNRRSFMALGAAAVVAPVLPPEDVLGQAATLTVNFEKWVPCAGGYTADRVSFFVMSSNGWVKVGQTVVDELVEQLAPPAREFIR